MNNADPNADRDPETLALFIEESQEALQRIEQQLLDAESGKQADSLMASLFRDIHTMKGSASFLAFDRTTRLAHVTEDLLAKLRDGALMAERHHFSLLMASVDLLRQFLDAIKTQGDEAPLPIDELIEKLRAAQLGETPAANAAIAATNTKPRKSPSRKTKADTAVSTAATTEAPASITTSPVATTDTTTVGTNDAEELSAPGIAALLQADVSAPTTESSNNSSKPVESADSTVRVNVSVLDRLMNLIGELVLARNQMVQIVKSSRDASVNTQAACQRLSLVTSDLQEQIMKTRMQPVARVFEKIPRLVRDLCQQTGKRVNPVIEGNATEIDKALVEAIRDPVLHIVRNAIDHGVEFSEDRIRKGKSAIGKLLVRAAHEGGTVTIEIKDDGKGMDPVKLRAHAVTKGLLTEAQAERLSDREALDLVFRPGFSTAAKVTDISGRGVGMDVVRTHIERAGGQVELESINGKGTTIRLKMPLTLAIIPALLVGANGQRFAIPQVNLLELVRLDAQQAATMVEHVRGATIYRLRGEVLPLVQLSQVLGTPPSPQDNGIKIVVVSAGTSRYGIVVDEVNDTEEIVIKPLTGALKRIPAYSGATVLGDGGVALILEVAGVASMSGIDTTARRNDLTRANSRSRQSNQRQSCVVIAAGDDSRCAIPLSMVSRLEKVPTRIIESVGGVEVVQYRDEIMPIFRPEAVVPMGTSSNGSDEQPLIVFNFGRNIAMAVNRIVDIAEVDRDQIQQDQDNEFVLGRTVALGMTTLMLDVYGMVRRLTPQFVQERRQHEHRPRVLLADCSNAMRSATAIYLANSGVEVIEAASLQSAQRELQNRDLRIAALITDLEFADGSGYELLELARRDNPAMPMLVWTNQESHGVVNLSLQSGARCCISKLAREQLVLALQEAGVLPSRRAGDETRSAA